MIQTQPLTDERPIVTGASRSRSARAPHRSWVPKYRKKELPAGCRFFVYGVFLPSEMRKFLPFTFQATASGGLLNSDKRSSAVDDTRSTLASRVLTNVPVGVSGRAVVRAFGSYSQDQDHYART